MIIDTHAHTSNHKLWGLHTPDASLDFLRAEAKKFGIVKIYLMATCFPLKKSGLSNLELLKRIANDPLFGVFGTLNAEVNDLAPALAELHSLAAAKLIDGLKVYAGYQNIGPDDEKLKPLYQLAEEFFLPVASHSGELHPCCPPADLDRGKLMCGRPLCPLNARSHLSHPQKIAIAAKRFPRVKFIACHLANPFFAELRIAMAENPNIYTDISGQFVSGDKEDTPEYRKILIQEIRRFLELPGGFQRVMFASDFPIQSYKDSLWLIDNLGLSTEQKNLLLWQNALALLQPQGEGK